MTRKKRIGLALSGGFAKGLSHIGVLKAIEDSNVPVDLISGTSIGALIGALWASGLNAEEIRKIARSIEWQNMLDFTSPREGFLEGKSIQNYINRLLKNKSFKELKIPLSIVAVDLRSGEKVIFDSGNVAKAVRCSISYPGVFTPVKIGKRELVDGGLIDPIPVDVVRHMGSDFVIGVNLAHNPKISQLKSAKYNNDFFKSIRERFFKIEISQFKNYLKAVWKLPRFIFKIIDKIIDILLTPKKIIDFLMRRPSPRIIEIMITSFNILDNQLKMESINRSRPDIHIHPNLEGLSWADFSQVDSFLERGLKAAKKELKNFPKI